MPYQANISLRETPSIRQLRAFMAVYQTGSLSAAGEALGLTQPAVSLLLKDLEEKLGVRLFDRTTRSLRRTAAAVEAIAYAQRALAELAALGDCMQDLAQARRGRVRIAATSTIAQTLLPSAIRQFLNSHPQVIVSINDCAPAEFTDRVLSEHVDFGIGSLEGSVPGLEQQVILDDTLCAVATGLFFPTHRPMSWKQLSGMPLIVVQPGYGVRSAIDRAVVAADVQLNIAYEVSLLTTALAMAANGLGVAVVPYSIVHSTHYADLVARRLIRPVVPRVLAVVRKESRLMSPSAQAFADMLARSALG
ncbi:LysR family transcriptional regulator [Achromobacter kerstersii]|uniref:HTH-type transcriptional regulator CynR n=1 Tax=Achromobacter kerstersii TaxID=1353890 RepID=A0A6S6ZV77_9BURK|nr:LysR family transcriptional regulator [Achromobacter kerstersii]CAB3663475.1 HTH-type transcriptional regulator CynR [Achromobacter kerstersii]